MHYLRANHAEWSPPSLISLDTETRVVADRDPQVLGLRCWAASYHDRRTAAKVAPRFESAAGEDVPSLVQWITHVTRNRECVWAYCHNLGFDLAVTRLPLALTEAGWEIHDAAVGGKSPWITMGRGKRVLTLVDSTSWWPMPLEDVARLLGMTKPPLPTDRDDLGTWLARCHADVDILQAALLEAMAWWDRQRLGRWAISGPASGWNAFRHTPAEVRPVIDPDPVIVKAERAYNHAGRRGTWRIGQHSAGPFVELDFKAAYPTIAAHLPLPYHRIRPFDTLPVDTDLVGSARWGITARVLVNTDTPAWPLRLDNRTWYPVGRFWADLAGPEIHAARQAGALEAIGPGWVHRLGHAMAPWARWCLSVQDGTAPDTPPVVQPIAKAWGRSVLGRWASRSFDRLKLGPAPTDAWDYEEGWDHTANAPGGMLDLAGQRWWITQSGTPDNAYPAVFAWVESEVRARLNLVLEQLGDGCLLQCDTDGIIVAARTVGTVAAHGALVAPAGLTWQGRLSWCLEQLEAVTAPLSLRQKAAHPSVFILGPQHVEASGVRRFAGLPGMAEPTGPNSYKARLWPGLSWQLRHGSPEGYVRPEVHVTVKGPYPTGWILPDGRVVPVEAELGRDGAARLVGWPRTRFAQAGLGLAEVQHQALTEVW